MVAAIRAKKIPTTHSMGTTNAATSPTRASVPKYTICGAALLPPTSMMSCRAIRTHSMAIPAPSETASSAGVSAR